MSSKSICLVAGEPSGDLQGSLLVAELRQRHPDWELWGVGSEKMATAGCHLWQDARHWAVMGFAEIVRSLWTFRQRLRALAAEIRKRQPHGVILIDYPGFNLRLAPPIHRAGTPILYYIVPQLWAWGRGRIKTFRRCVDRTVVVFPFEEEFFCRQHVRADWIGHPLVDFVRPSADRDTLREKLSIAADHKLVALMPGVRAQDYRAHLPVFREALRLIAASIPNTRGIIGTAPQAEPADASASANPDALRTTTNVYDLIAAADVVLTKTGTATVESAILGTPMVAAYRTSTATYAIARTLVDVPFVAMPNLIANRRIVPELVQKAVTPDALAAEAVKLLIDAEAHREQCQGLAEVRDRLGPPGAVQRAADVVEDWLEN